MTHAYTDEKADLVLQSEEGEKFRVYSYVLKANSNVFRHMLETCGSPLPTGKQGQPILIDYKTEAVVDFLDLIHVGRINGKSTWDRCHTLLLLVDRYDAPRLHSQVLLSLFDVLPERPWHILAIASQAGNIPLAKLAIAEFPTDIRKVRKTIDSFSKLVSEVPLHFVVGLLQAALCVTSGGNTNWKWAADVFQPADTK